MIFPNDSEISKAILRRLKCLWNLGVMKNPCRKQPPLAMHFGDQVQQVQGVEWFGDCRGAAAGLLLAQGASLVGLLHYGVGIHQVKCSCSISGEYW